eukprot:CAMPEP_0117520114 /NCGR_PEP_ID=MMETSP0784-20121206/33004_1 /TAXON_ID=39447 /ORGANISM="" /LENGTH=44 /DNA_ID= /DNA_START= /DNA_END= /DNA_ORIENTATION=
MHEFRRDSAQQTADASVSMSGFGTGARLRRAMVSPPRLAAAQGH